MSDCPPPDTSLDDNLEYLRLLHLADSALPIGALAHSFGLETLVSASLLDPGNLEAFFRGYLEEAGMLEAVFCRAGFRLAGAFSGERWAEINERLSALKPGRESRAASAVLGGRFLAAVAALGHFPLLEQARNAGGVVHHGPAFGLTSAVLRVEEERAVLAFLHQSAACLISACQRLLPLGQSRATAILWKLKPAIAQAAASRTYAPEDVPCFTPLLDWGAMEHPAVFTRLFIS